jgi:hypothetical protein
MVICSEEGIDGEGQFGTGRSVGHLLEELMKNGKRLTWIY